MIALAGAATARSEIQQQQVLGAVEHVGQRFIELQGASELSLIEYRDR
jgi:hypothetical protein